MTTAREPDWPAQLRAGHLVTHQRTGTGVPGVREACAVDRHPAAVYNPWMDASVCSCGRVWRPGNVVPPMTSAGVDARIEEIRAAQRASIARRAAQRRWVVA